MSSLALDWVRQAHGAIAARHLYPADHPRVVDAVAKLERLTERLTADMPEVSLFVVEGRLTCGGRVVPGADEIAERVFSLLHDLGYDRVLLQRGATQGELSALMSSLAGARDSQGRSGLLCSTTHIRLSAIDDRLPVDTERDSALAASIAELPALWQPIDVQRAIDTHALDRILSPLVETVAGGYGAEIPLASLASHDDYTATHITNVAVLTMALAQAVGISVHSLREIGVAALLHDIGKMKVPAEILTAPGRLTAEQLAIVRLHPQIGARMLIETRDVPHLAVVVAYEHHIQADGGGYPEVPDGWQVALPSAITHIADVYDALRTNRPYRAGLPHDTIVAMMMQDQDTVFPGPLLRTFFEQIVPRTSPASAETAHPLSEMSASG